MARQSWRLEKTGLTVPACFSADLLSDVCSAPQRARLNTVSRIARILSPRIFIIDLMSCGSRPDATKSQHARIPFGRNLSQKSWPKFGLPIFIPTTPELNCVRLPRVSA